jgi:hypothetical protein
VDRVLDELVRAPVGVDESDPVAAVAVDQVPLDVDGRVLVVAAHQGDPRAPVIVSPRSVMNFDC